MSYLSSILLPLLTFLISEVAGEFCSGYGHSCNAPEYCCSYTCCRPYKHYSFWSMWYFWCIVVFVLMACFGGCGYYRRRQVLIQRSGQPRAVVFASTTTHTVASQEPYSQQAPPPGFVEHPSGTFPAPPPYSEVTSKPYMYPKADGPSPPYLPPGSYYPPPNLQYQGQAPPPMSQLPAYEPSAPPAATQNSVSNQTTTSS
ncbi:actin-binding protein WASF2-like [Ptychodera flava]|uniref:actin-binding protein WASF2-like n=1 Tax=Ptychodera flava TaxID=63121 RepID=UPI00396A0695